ncbi:MAG: hypothetical protein EP311_01515, partial [Cytophagales bacterium]
MLRQALHKCRMSGVGTGKGRSVEICEFFCENLPAAIRSMGNHFINGTRNAYFHPMNWNTLNFSPIMGEKLTLDNTLSLDFT